MGQEILYCSKCLSQLRSADFEKGTAFHLEGQAYCISCGRETLPPEQLDLLLKRAQASDRAEPKSPSWTPKRSPTERIPKVASPAPSTRRSRAHGPSATSVLLFVGAGGVAILVLLLMAGGGSPSRLSPPSAPSTGDPRPDVSVPHVEAPTPQPEPARDPIVPGVSVEKREQTAKASLQKAREFASANPQDLEGQRTRFEEAVWEARKTTLEETARAELKSVEKRQLDTFSAELSAVDEKTRPALQIEDYSAVLNVLEEAKKRHPVPGWRTAIDGKLTQVNEAIGKLYAPLKEKALETKKRGADAELRSIRDRVAKWGLPGWTTDLDRALADASPPPSTSPPAPEAKPLPPPAPAPAPSPGKPARSPLPDAARQREAELGLRKVFPFDQAKTPKEKSELGRSLLQSAVTSGAKDVELYALLRQARILAAQGGDVRTAIEAIDALAAAFELEAMSEKLDLFTKATPKGTDAVDWAQGALELARDASEADDYETAFKLASRAETFARAAGDRAVQKTAEERGKEMTELRRIWEGVKPHAKMLESKPDDPAANSAVGKFVALVKEDWERGLPMLSKGSDPALKALAEQELTDPADAAAQVALGEAWTAQADKESPTYRARARARAAEWLARAIPGLSGLAKISAEKKLASLGPAGSKDRLTIDLGDGVRMELVGIKPGTFIMGTKDNPGGSDDGSVDERPEHKVILTKGYYLGKYEVTRGQFGVFVKATGYKTDAERDGKAWGRDAKGAFAGLPGVCWKNPNFPQTDDHPAVAVSWNDAKAFCDWATKKTGRLVRLPTEAEWEYASRAGTKASWLLGADDSVSDQYGWIQRNSGWATHPVGQKKPNAWGLFDTYGNGWEWCQDWAAPYLPGDAVDPMGPSSGDRRIARGGSLASTINLRCSYSYRLRLDPLSALLIVGFRVCVP